jgi:SAM-dependent methyltransferase
LKGPLPPTQIPAPLRAQFAEDFPWVSLDGWHDSTAWNTYGQVPALAAKLMDRVGGDRGRWVPKWSQELVDALVAAARTRDSAAGPVEYPFSGEQLFRALDQIPVVGLDAAVLGSVSPWAEAILLARGARSVVSVDYCAVDVRHPAIEFFLVGDPALRARRFDVVVSFSSIEHDGLGRYGDPINPTGDVSAVEEAFDMLRPGGWLLCGVPIGAGAIEGNYHRIYNQARLNRLFRVFGVTVEQLEAGGRVVPWPPTAARCDWTGGDWRNQPIFVLRKPEPPPTRLLVIGMEIPICDLSGASVRLLSFLIKLQRLGVQFDFVSFKSLAHSERVREHHLQLLADLGIVLHWGPDVDGLLQKNRYDAVVLQQFYWYSMSPMAFFLSSFMKFAPKTPLVLMSDDLNTMRNAQMGEPLSRAQMMEEFGTLAGADLVLAITDQDAARIREFAKLDRWSSGRTLSKGGPAPEKTMVLPYSVFDSPANVVDSQFDSRFGLVFLGAKTQLNIQSLQWFVNEVYVRVRAQIPTITLDVVGDLTGTGADLGITFHGSLVDPSAVFGRARVFVSPRTLGTGFTTKNVLALQHGLPVVTSAAGFEGFSDGPGTPILRAEDADDFVAKIVQLHQSREQWTKLASNAQAYVQKHFSVDASLPVLEQLCERIKTL